MNIKKYIPNTLTSFNLLSGVVAITFIMENSLIAASLLIFLAAVFDFLDGMAARILDARSEIGKQMDSLADVISFGVAPGILIFHMISLHCIGSCNVLERMHIAPYFALLIPLCGAWRLAKFNLDLRQEEMFYGLPIPANALFFASIPLVIYLQPRMFSLIRLDFMVDFFSNTRILAMLSVFFAYLMISEFRMFSVKFKSLGWKNNKVQFIFLISSVILVLLFSVTAIPFIILDYLLLSMFFQKKI
jgi:CDP-diacylglycerol--serine O-phosphatidyltransferase